MVYKDIKILLDVHSIDLTSYRFLKKIGISC